MPGQGVIVGVGAIDYPAEYQGADPATLADLGVSKVITLTSTYDHRIIQGAESGLFLKRVHELLLGEDELLRRRLRQPRRALRGRAVAARRQPRSTASRRCSRSRCRWTRSSTCTGCAATSSPTSTRCGGRSRRCTPSSTRPPTGSPSGTSTASSSPAAWPASDRLPLGDILHVLRDAYCRTIGIEYMHIQEPEEKRWIQEQVEGVNTELDTDEQRHILEPAQRRRGVREVPRHQVRRPEALRPRGRRGRHPASSTPSSRRRPTTALDGAVMGMAHRGRLNVLANIVGKSYDQIFKEFEGPSTPSRSRARAT